MRKVPYFAGTLVGQRQSGLAWLREEGASAAGLGLVEIVAEPQAQQLPLSIGQFRDGGMLVEVPFGEYD